MGSLKRRTETRPKRRTFLIFTEGSETEPDYINGLKRLDPIRRSASITVEVQDAFIQPLSLVKAAVEKTGDPEIDQVWCVFDVESPKPHAHLKEAETLARKHDIGIAVSNPCFELWLVLHDREQAAAMTTATAGKAANELAAFDCKRIVNVNWFLERRDVAVKRARKLDEKHLGDGNGEFRKANPSSGMPALLDALESAARG